MIFNLRDRSLDFVMVIVASVISLSLTALSDSSHQFLERYCMDCHDSDTTKGDFDLEYLRSADLNQEKTLDQWERVLKRVRDGEMPPPKKKKQPSSEERSSAVNALHLSLKNNSSDKGVLRRLNTSEYERSIESLLGIDFEVPNEFPPDTERNGFDNSAAGLMVSPSLMEAYFEAATQAADALFSPNSRAIDPVILKVNPKEFTFAETAGRVVGDAIRLAARTARISDSCIWPAKYEVQIPGTYKLRINASTFAPGSIAIPNFDGPMKLWVYAWPVEGDEGKSIGTMRKVAELEVDSTTPKIIECEIELKPTEVPVLYFANALIARPTDRPPSDFIGSPGFGELARDMLTRDKRLFATWSGAEIDGGLQRGSAWENLKKNRDDPNLNLNGLDHSKEKIQEVVNRLVKGIGFVDPVFTYQLFEEGPALQVHSLEITGPFNVKEDNKEIKRRKELVPRFFAAGSEYEKPEEKVRPIMEWFLKKAFRRPVSKEDLTKYSDIIFDHIKAGYSLEEGFHLAIRTALLSPRFLYRGHRPGLLDEWDLASRLSYFLTGAPPDDQLIATTSSGALSSADGLKAEANRLIDSNQIESFVSDYMMQWLKLRRLEGFIPDHKLIGWQPGHRKGMIAEAVLSFKEILQTNRKLETFIKPDFTWGNERLLNEIYGQKVKIPNWGIARIEIPEDARFGGLLTQAGMLTATSNGIETQPVVRGVWVLENILGDPPPPPPPGTPAIEPDTRGTKSVRELMAAHTKDAKCASCHRKIDPIGFVLENFDPIGRWRTHYPVWSKNDKGQDERKNGQLVEAKGEFPGGNTFEDIDDLKKYVLKNINLFGACLSEKLLTYAIGRRPNYAERDEIKQLVEANLAKGGDKGFRDLFLELITSKTFRTR